VLAPSSARPWRNAPITNGDQKRVNLANIGSVINQILLGGWLITIRKFISGIGKSAPWAPALFLPPSKTSFEKPDWLTPKDHCQQSLKAGIL